MTNIARPDSCRICASSSFERSYVIEDYTLVRCSSCGTQFNETYYLDETFRNGLFERNYYDSVQSEAFKHRLDDYESDPSTEVYNHYLQIVEHTLGTNPGNIIDVGSAFGTFLKVASNRGWTPHGVEYSSFSSSAARDHWGFEIFNGDITESPYSENQFDLITYWDVIEHVIDPRANLEKANALLKEGGLLLITTDNYRSLMSTLADLSYRLTLGKFTYAVKKFFIPYNTYYFTPQNFKVLLQSTGFEPVYFEKLDYPIDKLDVSGLEKSVVRLLYAVGNMMGMNTQFMYIAKKKGNSKQS